MAAHYREQGRGRRDRRWRVPILVAAQHAAPGWSWWRLGADERRTTALSLVRARTFREDLLYRLRSNAERLVAFYLQQLNARYGEGKTLADDTMRALMGYDWPGNVRQLRYVLESAYVMSAGRTILPDHLGIVARPPATHAAGDGAASAGRALYHPRRAGVRPRQTRAPGQRRAPGAGDNQPLFDGSDLRFDAARHIEPRRAPFLQHQVAVGKLRGDGDKEKVCAFAADNNGWTNLAAGQIGERNRQENDVISRAAH